MKRFHVHVAVEDLAASVRFYSALFGASPTVLKGDYAKWQLDDPRVNFAISNVHTEVGLDHLGIQTESGDELSGLRGQLERAEIAAHTETNTSCCYARSNKHWVVDPTGIAWETFHTLGDAPIYRGQTDVTVDVNAAARGAGSCCGPSREARVS